jgi:triphosphoribosyl-dephospho-CoA synthase
MKQLLKLNNCQRVPPLACQHRAGRHASQTIGRYALQSLHQELAAYPKPGLVSPVDSGSHKDMDAALFFRSLFSLRKYFCDIARAGAHRASFALLKQLGITAEERMLKATQGVNTHRGAIFNLGLLAASAGHLYEAGLPLQKDALRNVVRSRWGNAIRQHGKSLPQVSHGSQVASRYGAGGALHEAASGFPHLFEIGLPTLQQSLERGADPNSAAVQSLFSLIEVLPDTNLLYRGGESGLRFAQESAKGFLAEGGVYRVGWQKNAVEIHRQFVDLNLSPGGSAVLLAATVFVNRLQSWHATVSN